MAIFVFFGIAVGKGHSSKTCHWKGTFIQLLAMVRAIQATSFIFGNGKGHSSKTCHWKGTFIQLLAMVRDIQANSSIFGNGKGHSSQYYC